MVMRKIVIGFTFVFVMIFLTVNNGSASSASAVKGEPKQKKLDFSKEPVAYMAEIYKNYHNWQIDQGLESTKKALTIVDQIYKKDPDSQIKDRKFRRNRVFEIKSALHTLNGMLLFRKSITAVADKKKDMAVVMDKLDKKQEINEKDLEKLTTDLQKSKNDNEKKYYQASIAELRTAIQIDPTNPVPHFQLGTILSPVMAGARSTEAEKEFFTAVKLSAADGDAKSVERATEALKNLNPKSVYLAQIKKLVKDNVNVN
ncbi:MAG: hypothetical protein RBT37_04625 [Dissulfurispiraceae bacterium]|jgi:tetratricopeptide (TPR) repeat protein|nr:hypothetical protein [Dissulfurispiraceae bacterium]